MYYCRQGNIPDIIASGSLHEFLTKAHKQYGSIVSLWFGPKMCVSLGSAKLFAEQANIFDRGRKFICGNHYSSIVMWYNFFGFLSFHIFDRSATAKLIWVTVCICACVIYLRTNSCLETTCGWRCWLTTSRLEEEEEVATACVCIHMMSVCA